MNFVEVFLLNQGTKSAETIAYLFFVNLEGEVGLACCYNRDCFELKILRAVS